MGRFSFGHFSGNDWLTILAIIGAVFLLVKGILTPSPGASGGKSNNKNNNNNNSNGNDNNNSNTTNTN